MRSTTMKRFVDPLSPMSWFCFGFVLLPGLIIIFQPSIWEMVVFQAVDLVAFAFFQKLEQRLFLKLYPDSKLYFPFPKEDTFSKLSFRDRLNLYNSLIQFPLRRALYLFSVSFVKIVPAALVIVFYWESEGSYLRQFVTFFSFEIIVMAYFYGAIYIEAHIFVSQKIREYHDRFDWTDIFLSPKLIFNKNEFKNQELITLLSIAGFVILMQGLIAIGVVGHPQTSSTLIITVAICGVVLFSRITYLGRKYLFDGFEAIFQNFENIDFGDKKKIIPLHSVGILAKFENTVNHLSKNLVHREKEISHWMLHETEKSRFTAIGEISALIAHDLSTPLHVIQYCVDELKTNPKASTSPRFLKQLGMNTDQMLELVNTLRAHLRNPDQKIASCYFGDAHHYVVRLLETQFHRKDTDKICFFIDPQLHSANIKLARVDLIHILQNLYKNSIENLLNNDVKSPFISAELDQSEDNFYHILISDNGTGLDPALFDDLTSTGQHSSSKSEFQKGLGLKLTRRLIEQRFGSISVIAPNQNNGTQFLIKLPRSNAPKLDIKTQMPQGVLIQ